MEILRLNCFQSEISHLDMVAVDHDILWYSNIQILKKFTFSVCSFSGTPGECAPQKEEVIEEWGRLETQETEDTGERKSSGAREGIFQNDSCACPWLARSTWARDLKAVREKSPKTGNELMDLLCLAYV